MEIFIGARQGSVAKNSDHWTTETVGRLALKYVLIRKYAVYSYVRRFRPSISFFWFRIVGWDLARRPLIGLFYHLRMPDGIEDLVEWVGRGTRSARR
jgi:hypothetical protein